MIDAPYPELDELLNLVGEAGRRLSEIEASEGAAGNISVYVGWLIDPRRRFPNIETIALPQPVPEMKGQTFLVTGSGRRLGGPPSAMSATQASALAIVFCASPSTRSARSNSPVAIASRAAFRSPRTLVTSVTNSLLQTRREPS